MTSPRRSQFLLFGGEEEVPEGKEAASRDPQPAGNPREEDGWEYPDDAFPPDPFIALRAQTVQELEDAQGSKEALRQALCRYFKRGLALSFDHGELVDLLCISDDLLQEAGFSDADAGRVLADLLPSISSREIASTPLD